MQQFPVAAHLPWIPPATGPDDIERQNSHPSVYTSRPPTMPHDQQAPPPHPQAIYPVPDPVRPRLTKDQHEILERHFQQQRKPNTNTKKQIADNMGVPLDKINNWFQNRRAKVKQEMKKQLNALQMYPSLPLAQPFVQPVAMPSSTPPEFNGATAAQSIDISSGQALNTPAVDGAQQHALPFASQPFSMAPIIETSRSASAEEILGSLSHAGYAVQGPPSMVSAAQDSTFDFNQAFDPTVPNADFQLSGGEFQDMSTTYFEITPAFANISYHPISTTSAPEPQSEASASANTLPVSLPPQNSLCGQSSSNAMPGMTQAYCEPNWSGEVYPSAAATCSPPGDSLDIATLDSKLAQESMPNTWSSSSPPENVMPPASIYSHSSGSVPAVSPQSQGGANTPNSLQHEIPELPAEAAIRRNSSTALLAASIDEIELSKRSPVPSKAAPSIAARRQRHGPAALPLMPLQNASYYQGMPTSPGPAQNLTAPEQSLRRVRSSGINSCRVSKSTSAAQKSPLALSFAENVARHVSYSTASSPGMPVTAGNLAPPTPVTPNVVSRFPNGLPNESGQPMVQYAERTNTNGVPVTWAADLVAQMPLNIASPPGTPMDSQQMQQYREYLRQQSMHHFTPPQSAPATQQTFSTTLMHGQHLGVLASATDDKFARRPSLPDQHLGLPLESPAASHWAAVPMFNAAGDLHPMPLNLAAPLQVHHPVPEQPMQPSFAPHVTAPGVQTPVTKTEFSVVEYAPPTSQSQQNKAQSSTATPPLKGEGSRTLEFFHQGPRDFERSS